MRGNLRKTSKSTKKDMRAKGVEEEEGEGKEAEDGVDEEDAGE